MRRKKRMKKRMKREHEEKNEEGRGDEVQRSGNRGRWLPLDTAHRGQAR